MRYFPAFIDLQHQPVAVVGGGEIATRKAELALSAGAQVTVISPRLCASMQRLEIRHLAQEYQAELLADARICFAATDDDAVNQQVQQDCETRGILVNVVDAPELCRFITPSIIDREPLQIAIASGGGAPVLVRLLREKIEAILPEQLGELAGFAGRMRGRIKQRFATLGDRRRLWERFFTGPAQSARSEQERMRYLDQALSEQTPAGELYRLECSGEPDELTLGQLRLMQQVDAVYYAGAARQVLALARRDAEKHPLLADALPSEVQQRVAAGDRVLWLTVTARGNPHQ